MLILSLFHFAGKHETGTRVRLFTAQNNRQLEIAGLVDYQSVPPDVKISETCATIELFALSLIVHSSQSRLRRQRMLKRVFKTTYLVLIAANHKLKAVPTFSNGGLQTTQSVLVEDNSFSFICLAVVLRFSTSYSLENIFLSPFDVFYFTFKYGKQNQFIIVKRSL